VYVYWWYWLRVIDMGILDSSIVSFIDWDTQYCNFSWDWINDWALVQCPSDTWIIIGAGFPGIPQLFSSIWKGYTQKGYILTSAVKKRYYLDPDVIKPRHLDALIESRSKYANVDIWTSDFESIWVKDSVSLVFIR